VTNLEDQEKNAGYVEELAQGSLFLVLLIVQVLLA
jgi:hypothetical protein